MLRLSKKSFCRAVFIVAAAVWSGVAANAEDNGTALTLLSPCEYQVFQRQTVSTGPIVVRGRAAGDCDAVDIRITGSSGEGRKGELQTASVEQGTGKFEATIEVSAGGWYECEVKTRRGEHVVSQQTVSHVGVGEVFVVAGQSNSTNYGSERQKCRTGMVASFDGTGWRMADDPQGGVQDGSGGGSFLPAFGDALYERYRVPIGVASTGCGGTSVRQWLPKGETFDVQTTAPGVSKQVGDKLWECEGTLFDGLMNRIKLLGPNGFRAVLWHQGESDANQLAYGKDRQISPESYRRLVEKVIGTSQKEAGWAFPWFVAQATYHSPEDPSSEDFRQAQRALWESGIAMEGPDTDKLTGDYRDGVHFNGKGLSAHGVSWAEKVGVYLDKALAR